MRILNLIQCTNLGGMEQSTVRLMRALMKRGHECRLISLHPLGALAPLLKEAGIPALGLSYRGTAGWRSFHEIRGCLRAESADALIVTGHNLLAFLSLGRLCEGRRLLAIHFHHKGTKPRWQWRFIYGLARSRFDAITFPSDFVRVEAEELAPGIRGMARTVRNPVEVPNIEERASRHALKRRLGLAADVPLIGNAGWLIPRKRFDVFLQTAAHVLRAEPRARFVIAGDGERRAALQHLAERLGVAQSIHWLGWQLNLREFYAGIDVLLFNSDGDAYPSTPIEAMSHGRPVVASAQNSGLKEVITSDRFGILYETHNPKLLASSVLAALGPEGLEMGLRARERVAWLGKPDEIARQVEQLLNGGRECASPSP
jgi:glycosyltransferase involved in cell wall biosynthesis